MEGALQQIQDDKFWQSLPPHWGTKLATDLVNQAQSLVNNQLPAPSQQHALLLQQAGDVTGPSGTSLLDPDSSHALQEFVAAASASTSQTTGDSITAGSSQQLDPVQGAVAAAAQGFSNLSVAANQVVGALQGSMQEIAVPLQNLRESLTNLSGTLPQSTADGGQSFTALPTLLQQQMLQLQLQLADVSTGAHTLEPHFGTRAVLSWLQQLVDGIVATAGAAPVISQLPGFGANTSAEQLSASWQMLQNVVSQAVQSDAMTNSLSTVLPPDMAARLAAGYADLAASLLQLQDSFKQLPQSGMGGYDFATLCLVAAGMFAAVAGSVPPVGYEGAVAVSDKDKLSHDYSPAAAASYFQRRPLAVASRASQVAVELAKFGLALLTDVWSGKVKVGTCLPQYAATAAAAAGGIAAVLLIWLLMLQLCHFQAAIVVVFCWPTDVLGCLLRLC